MRASLPTVPRSADFLTSRRTGPLGVMRCVMVYFEHGLGEIALARSLGCAVTEDKGTRKDPSQGQRCTMVRFLSFRRRDLPYFGVHFHSSRAALVHGPANPPTASKFQHWDRKLGDFCRRGFFGFANKPSGHRIIPEKQTGVIRGRDDVAERGRRFLPRRQDPMQRYRWI